MKKIHLLIGILTLLLVGSLQAASHFNEFRYKDKSYSLNDPVKHYLSSNAIDTSVYEISDQTSLTIQTGSLKKPETKRYFQSQWNVKSLLIQNHEFESAFQLMKALRLLDKRVKTYSFWKLLSVKNENDIIFEKKNYGLGIQTKSHELFRVIKKDSKFYIINLKIQGSIFSDQEKESYIQALNLLSY